MLFLLKIFNILYFSLLCIFISFLPIYLSAQNISKSNIGLIIGLGCFLGILSQLLWGVISDKLRTIKKVILIILSISVVIGIFLYLSKNLFVLFLLTGLLYFFFMPCDPLVESFNYQMSQKNKVNYGSIRMFGALGYALASIIIGFASNKLGVHSLAILFFFYGILTFFTCLILPDVPASSKPVLFKDLKAFFSDKRTLLFFLLVFIMAIPHRMNDTFVGVYIESLGGNIQLVGQAWFIMTVCEVVFFAISHKFVKKGSELKVISVAAGFYVLRFVLCANLKDPIAIVCVQLLQGCTFVLFYSSAIQYLYSIVPEQWKSTAQTMLAVLFFGISSVFGSLAGGWIFDAFGGYYLYLAMAGLSAIGVLFSIVIMKHTT